MFTEQEIRDQINAITKKMSDANLGALILLDDDRYVDGGNVRYLTNIYPLFAAHPMVLVITPQDVTLCLVPGLANSSIMAAKQQCPWLNVVGSKSGLWGSNLGKDIKNALDQAKIHGGKVGIDGLEIMSESLSKSIREELMGFQLVEETGIVERMRMIKSPSEIKAIREAARLTDIGVTAFMASIKSGEPQYIAISKSEYESKIAGAEAALIFMGVGAPWIWGQYPSSRIYKDGDMISIEYNARFQGYWGQVTRSCVVGKPTDEQKEVNRVAFETYKAMESILKPGVTASELYKVAADVMTQAGFSKPPRQGHGLGLRISEGFTIDENDQTLMQPGFYVMLHSMVTILDKGIGATVGNSFLITDKSYELLSKARYPMSKCK